MQKGPLDDQPAAKQTRAQSEAHPATRNQNDGHEVCQVCYLAGRSSEHDFMKCPIFRETTFTSEHLSPPVAPMIEQLRRQDLGSNPVFGSARSTAQTATKRVITQEEFDRKWPTWFAGNLLHEKGNGQYVIFDGPLFSGTIPTSSGKEEDK